MKKNTFFDYFAYRFIPVEPGFKQLGRPDKS